MSQKKFLTIFLVFSLMGCSLGRKKNATSSHPISFVLMDHIDWQQRSPALFLTSNDLSHLSHKELYFQTLAGQFQQFSQAITSPLSLRSIPHCPNFHNSFLEFDFDWPLLDIQLENKNHLFSLPSKQENKTLLRALFLELNLPLHQQTKTPLVYHAIKEDVPYSQAVRRGLNAHVNKIHRELQQLCQDGYSQNYYLYENMIQHTKQKPLKKRSIKSLLSLLKITVFANYALIQSLDLKYSPNSKEREIMLRLNALWTFQYLNQLKQRKRAFLLENVKTTTRTQNR